MLKVKFQKFILDLYKEFEDIKSKEIFIIDLYNEVMYDETGTRYIVPAKLFYNLPSNLKALFEELQDGKKINGFCVGELHFIPLRHFGEEKKYFMKFQKGSFLDGKVNENLIYNFTILLPEMV